MPAASPLPVQGMIIINAKVGAAIPDAWWDELMQKFRQRGLGSQEASALYTLLSERNLGLALPDPRLQALCSLVIAKVADLPEPHFCCGEFSLRSRGDANDAMTQFGLALASTPAHGRPALHVRIAEAMAATATPTQMLPVSGRTGTDLRH